MTGLRIERVVVTGGRKFTDGARIEADLRALLPFGLVQVAEGQCPFGGADELAHEAWWRIRNETTNRYPMRRDIDGPWASIAATSASRSPGRGAYLRRNIRMLEDVKPDLVLAYPDPESRGTWHCVREAVKRSIPVIVWHDGVVVTTANIDASWTVFHAPTPAEVDKRAGLLKPPPPGFPLDLYGQDMPTLLCVLAGVKMGTGTIQRGMA